MKKFIKKNENEYSKKGRDFRALGYKENKNNVNTNKEFIVEQKVVFKEKNKNKTMGRKYMKKYYLSQPKSLYKQKEKSQSIHSDDIYFT